jgi:hypothetical protein
LRRLARTVAMVGDQVRLAEENAAAAGEEMPGS